ncbi:uncharacterized protein LOC141665308 [Apium graveolens]|uniref:uncharacterized protein LOC141665308 n=1 Tax=Apium graveolens TaxID=4045 RepID=UPI003D7BEEA1
MVGLFVWRLWHRRNKWVWYTVNMFVFGLKMIVFNMLADWRRAREVNVVKQSHSQAHRSWLKPPAGWIKVNVDVACSFQPKEAETLRLKEALSWTKEWRTTKCVFESEAKLLADAVQGTRGASFFDSIVEDCNKLIKYFDEVLLVFIHRSMNQVAYLLARAACSMSGLLEWNTRAPYFITCTLAFEEI